MIPNDEKSAPGWGRSFVTYLLPHKCRRVYNMM